MYNHYVYTYYAEFTVFEQCHHNSPAQNIMQWGSQGAGFHEGLCSDRQGWLKWFPMHWYNDLPSEGSGMSMSSRHWSNVFTSVWRNPHLICVQHITHNTIDILQVSFFAIIITRHAYTQEGLAQTHEGSQDAWHHCTCIDPNYIPEAWEQIYTHAEMRTQIIHLAPLGNNHIFHIYSGHVWLHPILSHTQYRLYIENFKCFLDKKCNLYTVYMVDNAENNNEECI